MERTARARHFWDSVKGNLTLFKDIADILHLIKGPVTPVIEADEADYVSAALAALPQGELTLESWSEWTQSLKQSTGRKGRALFMPLRQALTGQAHGPGNAAFTAAYRLMIKLSPVYRAKPKDKPSWHANAFIFLTPPCATASKRPAWILPCR
jgi:hypothetical protein